MTARRRPARAATWIRSTSGAKAVAVAIRFPHSAAAGARWDGDQLTVTLPRAPTALLLTVTHP